MSDSTPFTRRRALAVGIGAAAGAALTNTSPAHADAESDAVQLTAAELATDPVVAIQQAVDAMAEKGGGTVHLPAGTYALSEPLWLRSRVTLVGKGPQETMLRDADTLGANPVVLVIGTREERITDVQLRDLAVRNGTATNAASPPDTFHTELSVVGKEGIVAEYVDGLTMHNILVTEIAGKYGFRCKMARRIACRRSRFYRCTYAAFMLLVESEHVTVDHCEFDTITTAPPVYPNQYLFATGSERRGQGEFLVRDVLVQNSRFLNNPHWQAINTHGGERITFRNNYCENVLIGTIAANVVGFAKHSALQDILIEGNTYLRGTATDDGIPTNKTTAGISVAGNITALGRNICVRGNRLVGFGGGLFTQGALLTYRVHDIVVEDNVVEDFHQYGMVLFSGSYGAVIRNNVFDGMASSITGLEDVSAVIGVPVDGQAYGIQVTGNTVRPAAPEHRPARFIWTTGPHMNFVIAHNNIGPDAIAQAAIYHDDDHLPLMKNSTPSQYLILRRGERVTNAAGRTVNICASPRQGFGSLDTSTVLALVNTSTGSSHITIAQPGYVPELNVDFFTPYGMFPPGMNIIIEGGDGQGDLTARVADIVDATTVALDTVMPRDLSGVRVRRQTLTWQRA